MNAIEPTTRSFFRRRGTKHRLDMAVVLALWILTQLGPRAHLPRVAVSYGTLQNRS